MTSVTKSINNSELIKIYGTRAACRGDCYQVKDTDDAVRELWKRKDEADCKFIASLRLAAGLPSNEELVPACSYLDDEQSGPVISKNDSGRSLKFSVAGFSDISSKRPKECGGTTTKDITPNKKHLKKTMKFAGDVNYQKNEERSTITSKNQSVIDMNTYKAVGSENLLSSAKTPYNEGERPSAYLAESNTYSSKELTVNNVNRVSKVVTEDRKLQGLHRKEHNDETESKNETIKGTKLVIHLGSRNINVSSSPRSETSTHNRNHVFPATYGAKHDDAWIQSSKHGDRKSGRMDNDNTVDDCKLTEKCTAEPAEVEALGKNRAERDDGVVFLKKKQSTGSTANLQNDFGHRLKFISGAAPDDPKPLLKLKFKNPYFEQRSSWASRGEEENPVVKGQRSKRKRSSVTEKVGAAGGGEEDNLTTCHLENPLIDQEMDANWILQKLEKDAIGKRVEVHQSSDNTWRQGVVSDVTIPRGSSCSSSLLVRLDDGRWKMQDVGPGEAGSSFTVK